MHFCDRVENLNMLRHNYKKKQMIVQMQNKRIDLCIKRCKNFKKDVFFNILHLLFNQMSIYVNFLLIV